MTRQCTECTDLTGRCGACKAPYELNSGTYSCECPSGFYDTLYDCVQCDAAQWWDSNVRKCKRCGQGCAVCSDDTAECTECNATYIPDEENEGECICPPDTYDNKTECVAFDDCSANQYQWYDGCRDCGENCDTCDDFTGVCNTCTDTYMPKTQKSLDCECMSDLYLTGESCV